MKKYHKNAVIIKLSPVGGGGNPKGNRRVATEELIANRCAHIYIDTNNMDPPNQFGRDVFRIPVLKSGQLDPKGGYMTGPLSKNKLEYEEY